MHDALLTTFFGWLAGGFVNGIVGFGAALVAMPIVTLGLDMRTAVPTCGLVVLALNIQMTWLYRASLKKCDIRALAVGAFPGALTGVLLLRLFPEESLKTGLGLLLVLYAVWGLACTQPQSRRLAPGWVVLAGFFSASLGTAFGFNGPPLAVYLSLRGGLQNEIKATLGAFFIVSGAFIIIAHGLSGLHSTRSIMFFIIALPAVILGGWIGTLLASKVRETHFKHLIFLMILIMGISMFFG